MIEVTRSHDQKDGLIPLIEIKLQMLQEKAMFVCGANGESWHDAAAVVACCQRYASLYRPAVIINRRYFDKLR
jgi:hypothetical protein